MWFNIMGCLMFAFPGDFAEGYAYISPLLISNVLYMQGLIRERFIKKGEKTKKNVVLLFWDLRLVNMFAISRSRRLCERLQKNKQAVKYDKI